MSSITNLFSGLVEGGKEQKAAIQGIHVLVSNIISRRWQCVLHLRLRIHLRPSCPKPLDLLSQRPSDSCKPSCPGLSCLKQCSFRYNFALKKVAANLLSNEGCHEHRLITDIARCLSPRVFCLSVITPDMSRCRSLVMLCIYVRAL